MTFSKDPEPIFPFASSASSDSRIYSFIVEGEADGIDDGDEGYKLAMDKVEAYVATDFATTPDGLTPQGVDNCELLGLHPIPRYRVDIAYGNAGPPTVFEAPSNGDVIFNMDITTQSVRTNYSYEHLAQVMAPTKTSPATEALNVDQLGVPQGVDVPRPAQTWSIEYYVANSFMTNSYRENIEDATGKVNSTAFNYRSAGEVLFTGARLSKRGNDAWRITFGFSVSPNRYGSVTPFTVAGITINQDVQGWDVLDPIVEPQDATGKVQPTTIGFNIQRVFDRADLSTELGIPGF